MKGGRADGSAFVGAWFGVFGGAGVANIPVGLTGCVFPKAPLGKLEEGNVPVCGLGD